MKRHALLFLTLLILVLGITTSALAFTFITFNAPSSVSTFPDAINNPGRIAGLFNDSSRNNELRGFLRNKNDTFTTIDPPDSILTRAEAINNSGQVIGFFFDSSGEHGFLAVP
jgi:hypothetical protein